MGYVLFDYDVIDMDMGMGIGVVLWVLRRNRQVRRQEPKAVKKCKLGVCINIQKNLIHILYFYGLDLCIKIT